jgi:hypothetical protein
MTRSDRACPIHFAAEVLEDRIAPATLPLLDLSGGTITGTFTDVDGDTVTVRIEGTAGEVEFQDANGNSVEDGENIASVIITGASANFALTYSFDASGGVGSANNVTMGNITSNKVLLGIYSVPLNSTTGTFTLGSFVGPGFSPGGGLSADDVVGNVDGLGLQVKNLEAGRSINIRNTFIGDLIIQGGLGGSIVVGGVVDAASAWRIARTVAPTAQIAIGNNFNGTFEAGGVFAGEVSIDGTVTGSWLFNKSVVKSAQLTAESWENIQALKNWGGQLLAFRSDITMAVGGQILGTSVFSGEGRLELTVDGSVQSGAAFGFTSDITATVGGNLAGNWASSQDLTLTVSGNVSGAVISSGSDLSLTVTKGLLKSQVYSDQDLVLDVSGSVNSTDITAADTLTAEITAKLAASQVSSGETLVLTVGGDVSGTRVGGDRDMTVQVFGRLVSSEIRGEGAAATPNGVSIIVDLDVVDSIINVIDKIATLAVGRNLIASAIQGNEDVQVAVAGSLSSSKVTAGSDAIVAVTGNVTRSTVTSSESNVTLTVGGNFLTSSVTSDEDMEVSIDGNMSGLLNSFDSGITLTVGGTLSGRAIAGGTLIADIGQLTGALTAEDLDLIVQGNVATSARIQATEVDDFNADTFGFHVDGNFAGLLNVGDFDSDVVGGSTLVEGDVLKTARFLITGPFGETADESFNFGGDFLGVLNIGDDIDVNLAFNGNVNQVIIGGLVGTSGLVNTITISGKLKFLSSGSLFDETTPGEGSFQNGAGTVSATLSVGDGFIVVIPTA